MNISIGMNLPMLLSFVTLPQYIFEAFSNWELMNSIKNERPTLAKISFCFHIL